MVVGLLRCGGCEDFGIMIVVSSLFMTSRGVLICMDGAQGVCGFSIRYVPEDLTHVSII
jgi:hypothetical protein